MMFQYITMYKNDNPYFLLPSGSIVMPPFWIIMYPYIESVCLKLLPQLSSHLNYYLGKLYPLWKERACGIPITIIDNSCGFSPGLEVSEAYLILEIQL